MKNYDVFNLKSGDVISLNTNCFDGNTKDLRPLTKIKINDHNSFSIAKDGDCIRGTIVSHSYEYYSLKEIIKIIYMFLFRKPKKEYVNMEWI